VLSATIIAVVGPLLLTTSGCSAAGPGGVGGPQILADPVPADPEFRGIFVTTAFNLDWPSKPALHRRVQRDEIAAIVSHAKDLNCNVIMLQVRAFGDRIYKKTSLPLPYHNEPWAMALNFGKDPDTGPIGNYDALETWIDECNEAGIELHAWVNPFRVNNLVTVKQSNKDVYLPVFKSANGQLWLNYRSKAVQDYVLAVIEDLLANYYYCPPEAVHPVRAMARMMRTDDDDDGGMGGIIYDHYMPEPPPLPTGDDRPPSTRPARRAAPAPAAAAAAAPPAPTVASAPPRRTPITPEERIDWLVTKYKNGAKYANDTEATLDDFIARSSALIRPCAKFGFSPEAKDATAKKWLADGKFDYVVPELYFKRTGNTFRQKLEEWLDANTASTTPKPLVVAGLFTKRAQEPEDDEEEPWAAQEFLDEMTDVHQAKGHDGQKASGEAHYASSALRLPDQAGPNGQPQAGPHTPRKKEKNLGERLKDKNGHYEKRAMVPKPPPRPGNPPGAAPGPVTVSMSATRELTWQLTGAGKVRRWAVWLYDNVKGEWGNMEVYPKRVQELDNVPANITAARVKAIDKDGRESPFGSWPP
jgi:uncharacterized lipoprotein YddW (UPF0748 family)